jgi:hypothetical protein
VALLAEDVERVCGGVARTGDAMTMSGRLRRGSFSGSHIGKFPIPAP